MLLDAQSLAAYRSDAAHTRAAWLTALSDGVISVSELVEYATTEHGYPLRSLRLSRLVKSLPGESPVTVRQAIARLGVEFSVPDPNTLTVGYLLDGRAGGRRRRFEVVVSGDVSPWPGFPFQSAEVAR